MTLKQLIELGDVQEKQAFAYLCYLNSKNTSVAQLQQQVDTYCNNLAGTFILKYKNILQDKNILVGLRKHISCIGADKPHSGNRFYEALYNSLNNMELEGSNNLAEDKLL